MEFRAIYIAFLSLALTLNLGQMPQPMSSSLASLRVPAGNAQNQREARESRAQAAAQRQAPYLQALREFRGYLRGSFVANHQLIEEALVCLESYEVLQSENCTEFHQKLESEILPAFHRVRILYALQGATGMRGQGDPGVTENRSVFTHWKNKINANGGQHSFNMHADWVPGGVDEDVEPAEIQQLSVYEILQALSIYKRDGVEHRNQWDQDSGYIEEYRELQAQLTADHPDQDWYVQSQLRSFRNRSVSARNNHVNRMRSEDRQAYQEEYLNLVQEFPIIAFMEMPVIEESVEDANAYVWNQICRFPELTEDRNVYFRTEDDFLNQSCRSEESPIDSFISIPISMTIRQLSRRPRYHWDLEHYLPSLRRGMNIIRIFSESMIQMSSLHNEEEQDYDSMLMMVAYDKAFADFQNTVAQTDIESREEIFQTLQDDWDSQLLRRDLLEAGVAIGFGLACNLGLRRIPLAGRLAGFVMRTFGVAAAGCVLFAGLGVNLGFLGLANNRHYQAYQGFFTSLGELESQNPEFQSEDGTPLTSRVLVSIDELEERDTGILFELIFLGIGTGIGDVAPVVRNLLTRGN